MRLKSYALAAIFTLLICAQARTQSTPGCGIREFKIILEGWTRGNGPKNPQPCSVIPISPQPTCTEAPCFNIACRALLHYHAMVELSSQTGRLYPACNFKQQRMGRRSHYDGGKRPLDQYEPEPVQDFAGSVEDAPGYHIEAVPGQPRLFSVDFYDLPGWLQAYWNGQPNATAPKWFPLDWHYMYRAYLGPKQWNILEDDYLYARIDMEARVAPELAIEKSQSLGTLDQWKAFQKSLKDLENSPGALTPSGNVEGGNFADLPLSKSFDP